MRAQSEEEMFSANSDTPEEDDDEDDECSTTVSQQFAAAAEKPVRSDDAGDDDFPYDVLTADELVQHMVDCIKEVNSVVQVHCSRCRLSCPFYFVLSGHVSAVL